jgi:hypothetical protein
MKFLSKSIFVFTVTSLVLISDALAKPQKKSRTTISRANAKKRLAYSCHCIKNRRAKKKKNLACVCDTIVGAVNCCQATLKNTAAVRVTLNPRQTVTVPWNRNFISTTTALSSLLCNPTSLGSCAIIVVAANTVTRDVALRVGSVGSSTNTAITLSASGTGLAKLQIVEIKSGASPIVISSVSLNGGTNQVNFTGLGGSADLKGTSYAVHLVATLNLTAPTTVTFPIDASFKLACI